MKMYFFPGRRRLHSAGSEIRVSGVPIKVGSTMRYLGIVLDSRWRFVEHFRRLAPRLVGVAGALGSLLPNLRGARGGCRRLYTGVIRSMALYGAPIWADALSARNRPFLRRPQRVMALRVVRAYRTVSFEAACVMAGTPPWELDAEMLADVYRRVSASKLLGLNPSYEEVEQWRDEAVERRFREWERRLEEPSAGERTVAAIRPVLREWCDRRHGAITFRLTQVLSGHGCFGRYLCKVARREPSMACHWCACPEDTADHTLAVCPAWAEPRARLVAVVGSDLSLPSIVRAMVGSDRSWRAVITFSEDVISRKEEAERVRERDPHADPIRRRRPIGRRRRVAADLRGRNQPP
ncbi:unnamed protein product [Colias eurytheme]|nr:unnamed protein product [Colias eurytheme]